MDIKNATWPPGRFDLAQKSDSGLYRREPDRAQHWYHVWGHCSHRGDGGNHES